MMRHYQRVRFPEMHPGALAQYIYPKQPIRLPMFSTQQAMYGQFLMGLLSFPGLEQTAL